MKKDFESWMSRVDWIIEAMCGLSSECLVDWPSRDAYDEGLTPRQGVGVLMHYNEDLMMVFEDHLDQFIDEDVRDFITDFCPSLDF